jgi:hypothetical protein
MSVDSGWIVYCDHEDCRETQAVSAPAGTVAQLMVQLEWEWTATDDGRDLCPKHPVERP